jgi:hypothetical protein
MHFGELFSAKLTSISSAGIHRPEKNTVLRSIEGSSFKFAKRLRWGEDRCEYALYAACSERPVLIVSVRMFAFLDEKLTFKKSSALFFTSVPSAAETA